MAFNKHQIIANYLSGNATPKESQQLTDWLEQSPLHRQELAELEKMWQLSRNLKKNDTANVNAAWHAFEQLAAAPRQTAKVRPLWLRPLPMAAAALICVTAFFTFRFFVMTDEPAPVLVLQPEQPVTKNTTALAQQAQAPVHVSVKDTLIQPAPGEVKRAIAMVSVYSDDSARVFLLPDQKTKVYLNKHSQLTYAENFKTGKHRVTLVGEAFFELQDSAMPFFVNCKNITTKAIGSSFNVKGYKEDREAEVAVMSGQVEMTRKGSGGQKFIVKAGDIGEMDGQNTFMTIKNAKKTKWWQKNNLKNRLRNFFKKVKDKIS